MSNNRMYIKCLKCNNKKMIAKYYPTGGWYFECISDNSKGIKINHPGQIVEMLEKLEEDTINNNQTAFNDFMKIHRHGDNSFCGPTHFVIEFGMTKEEN